MEKNLEPERTGDSPTCLGSNPRARFARAELGVLSLPLGPVARQDLCGWAVEVRFPYVTLKLLSLVEVRFRL